MPSRDGYPPQVTSSIATDVPAVPVRPRPLVVLGAVLAGIVVTLAGLSGQHLADVAAVLVTGLVVARGWPRLVRSPAPVGAGVVLALTTLALAVALLLQSGPPRLQQVPVAVAGGVVLMCLHPLVREDARTRLAELLTGTSLGILVLVSGAVLVTTHPVDATVATVAGVSVSVAALVDLVLERPGTAAWMLPVEMLVGGVVGLLVHVTLGEGGEAGPVLVGLAAAAVALCLRRAISQQPALTTAPGAVAAGVASVLFVGPVVLALARMPIT